MFRTTGADRHPTNPTRNQLAAERKTDGATAAEAATATLSAAPGNSHVKALVAGGQRRSTKQAVSVEACPTDPINMLTRAHVGVKLSEAPRECSEPTRVRHRPAAISSTSRRHNKYTTGYRNRHRHRHRHRHTQTHTDTHTHVKTPLDPHSPVIEAPDERQNRQVVQEGQVAGYDDGELERGLNPAAEHAQQANRRQQQPRRPQLHHVVDRRLEPAHPSSVDPSIHPCMHQAERDLTSAHR